MPRTFTILINALGLLAVSAATGLAHAQLLPQVPLPALPQVQLPERPLAAVLTPTLRELRELRNARVRDLLRRNPRELDRDPRGAPIQRGVFLALSPTEAALATARAAGFAVQGERELEGLGGRVVTLVAPAGWNARRGLDTLRRLDPAGRYDFNHLYFESAAPGPAVAPASGAVAPGGASGSSTVPRVPGRVGLIDSGVASAHPAFRVVAIHRLGCDGREVAAPHGTAVASLLVGSDGAFRGAAPGAELYAADVYCGKETGGLVDTVVQSLAWLAREEVRVVNVSLVGPPNLVLEAVVRALVARGMIIVAAVGNDGPAAPPLYPASYEGVIGVTAVDGHDRLLLEDGRGAQVDFAAPGADISAALPPAGYAAVRGTSYAAPLVAGLLVNQSVESLISTATDLGPKGRDARFGEGLVGAGLRAALVIK